jgi:hypothetical protein
LQQGLDEKEVKGRIAGDSYRDAGAYYPWKGFSLYASIAVHSLRGGRAAGQTTRAKQTPHFVRENNTMLWRKVK